MANEIKKVYGTQKTVSTSIAAIANNAISAAVGTYSATDTLDYPDADFVLVVTFATAPTEGSTIDLLVRPMDVQGANGTVTPEATYQPHRIGTFVVDNVTAAQYLFCSGFDLPKAGELYLYNNATGQSTSANASLYMTPRTLAPV